ncbi:MAG: DUF169 domain-containing protein [Promethearchaeota archaeon]
MSETKTYSVEDYQKSGDELFRKLHTATHPIAVKYIKNLDEVPDGVKRPSDKDLKMSICQAFTQSRRFSEHWCITAEDNFCIPSIIDHGWIKLSKEEYVEMQKKQDWYTNPETLERFIKNQYMNNVKDLMDLGYIGVVSAPLNETTFIPDCVVIYGNGKQLTYMIQSLGFERRKEFTINISFGDYGESCKKTFRAFLNNRPEIIIPANCERAICLVQDEEVAMALPAKAAFYVSEYLFSTGRKQGLKMPLRQVMPRLTEEINPGYVHAKEILDKSEK